MPADTRRNFTSVHVVHNPFGYEGFNLPMISLDDAYIKIIKETEDDLHGMIDKEKQKD